ALEERGDAGLVRIAGRDLGLDALEEVGAALLGELQAEVDRRGPRRLGLDHGELDDLASGERQREAEGGLAGRGDAGEGAEPLLVALPDRESIAADDNAVLRRRGLAERAPHHAADAEREADGEGDVRGEGGEGDGGAEGRQRDAGERGRSLPPGFVD